MRPDASTWLRFPSDGAFHDLLVWWEIDRSTEGLEQFAQKIAGYKRLLRDQATSSDGSQRHVYQRHWPSVAKASRRVFIVAESQQRIGHIVTAIRQLPGVEFVRLTTRGELTADTVLTKTIWQDVNAERRAILPKA